MNDVSLQIPSLLVAGVLFISSPLASSAQIDATAGAPGGSVIISATLQASDWMRFNVAFSIDPRLTAFLEKELGPVHTNNAGTLLV